MADIKVLFDSVTQAMEGKKLTAENLAEALKAAVLQNSETVSEAAQAIIDRYTQKGDRPVSEQDKADAIALLQEERRRQEKKRVLKTTLIAGGVVVALAVGAVLLYVHKTKD